MTCVGSGKSYPYKASGKSLSITDLPPGSYNVTVSKDGYVTRTYPAQKVTATAKTLTADIRVPGDIDGDGKIGANDNTAALAHVKGVKLLSGYELAVGDINGTGKLEASDAAAIGAHVKGTKLLK